MDSIYVNQKAEIIIQIENRLCSLMCALKEIENNFIGLELLESDKDLIAHISINQMLEVNLYSCSGLLSFQSRILKIQDNMVSVKYPVQTRRIQRREYFRISLKSKVEIFFSDGEEDIYIEGYTIDISGGGVRIMSDYPLEPGFVIELHLHLQEFSDTNEPMVCKARVLSCKTHESYLSFTSTEISCLEFIDLGTFARKQLMQCCFKLQLDARRKGLL